MTRSRSSRAVRAIAVALLVGCSGTGTAGEAADGSRTTINADETKATPAEGSSAAQRDLDLEFSFGPLDFAITHGEFDPGSGVGEIRLEGTVANHGAADATGLPRAYIVSQGEAYEFFGSGSWVNIPAATEYSKPLAQRETLVFKDLGASGMDQSFAPLFSFDDAILSIGLGSQRQTVVALATGNGTLNRPTAVPVSGELVDDLGTIAVHGAVVGTGDVTSTVAPIGSRFLNVTVDVEATATGNVGVYPGRWLQLTVPGELGAVVRPSSSANPPDPNLLAGRSLTDFSVAFPIPDPSAGHYTLRWGSATLEFDVAADADDEALPEPDEPTCDGATRHLRDPDVKLRARAAFAQFDLAVCGAGAVSIRDSNVVGVALAVVNRANDRTGDLTDAALRVKGTSVPAALEYTRGLPANRAVDVMLVFPPDDLPSDLTGAELVLGTGDDHQVVVPLTAGDHDRIGEPRAVSVTGVLGSADVSIEVTGATVLAGDSEATDARALGTAHRGQQFLAVHFAAESELATPATQEAAIAESITGKLYFARDMILTTPAGLTSAPSGARPTDASIWPGGALYDGSVVFPIDEDTAGTYTLAYGSSASNRTSITFDLT